MKQLLITAVALALAAAKPETYRENEDFQYSRSSSDDGTKAGYYGAQRGNMGGNYERAHNMDSLAQNQMSGLVRQVEGELGDGSNTRTGSVYSAANSRGVYGSGRYDLTNLEGRNFHDSESRDNSQSHSSVSSLNSGYSGQSSSASSSGYNSNQARDSRYQATKNSGRTSHASNLQASQSSHAADAYDYNRQSGYNSGYQAQSGYRSGYTNQHGSDVYGSNPRTRLVGGTPARVVIRPGTTVIVPIAAQTYDSGHSASAFDQNAINTDAEVLSNTNHEASFRPSTSSNPKHYDSSYSYRKEWERHDTHTAPPAVPLAVPTDNPFPRNSELYDDTQASRTSDARYHASGSDYQNTHGGYHSNVKSAATSQSRHQSDYNSQHSSLSSGSNSNAFANGAYNTGAAADATNVLGDGNGNKPKSYQSAYSYHKSWERQGDPYVIYPATKDNDGQASQKLTDAADNQQYYSSHQYGSNYKHGQQHQSYSSADDCDENGHRRVARSYNVPQNQEFNPYQQSQTYEDQADLGQQLQNGWGNFQQEQSLEDVDQRSQNLEDFGQRSQNLEYLGQETQNLQDLRQYNQNLEEFGQQSQNKWDRLEVSGQQSQNNNFEEFGQQTQTDFGQHTQDTREKETNNETTEKLEDLSQQAHNQWENSEDLGQQVQGPWTTLQDQKHKNRSHDDQENGSNKQVIQSNFENLHRFNQQSQTSEKENANTNQTHHYNILHGADGFESQNTDQNNHPGFANYDQESQSTSTGENLNQQFNRHLQNENEKLGQQSQNSFSKLDTANQDKRVNITDEVIPSWEQTDDDNTQQVSQITSSDIFNDRYGKAGGYFREQNGDNFNQQIESTNGNHNWNTNDNKQNGRHEQVTNTHNISQSNSEGRSSLQNLWNKINNFEQVSSMSNNKNDNNKNGSYFSHGYENTQNSDQNTWGLTSNSNSNFNHNQFESGYGGNQPSQTSLFNEMNTTSKTTTVKPENEQTLTHNVENLRPQDVGRGDIGPDDTSVPLTFTTTEKSYVVESKPISPVFILGSNDKRHKTPEEIDVLSLTKETNKTMNNKEMINENQNTLQSDKTLSVLSLNQQRWLEEQRQHASTERNSVHLSNDTNNQYYLSNNKTNAHNDSQRFNKHSVSESTFYHNKPNNHVVDHKLTSPVSDSQNKPNDKIDHTQTNVGFEQVPDEIEQQNMEQQFENLGQFEQQSKDLGQQSQTVWGQNFDEFGQQEQTAWRPQEELQQSNTQQIENLGTSNHNQFQTSDFYNQRYNQQRSQNIEDLQTAPESSKKVEDIQSVPQKNTDFVVISSPEASTVQPGFWKSVGSKFTNAKDKVASWFKS